MEIGLIWFILICLVIGVALGFWTGYWSASTIWVPKRQSPPDLSTVSEDLERDTDSAKKHVLIAYNTKNGGSVVIAKKIQDELRNRGFRVDLRFIPNMQNADISHYDAYIVGGAVYWSMFMHETREFIAKHFETFKTKPSAFYMVCGKMCNEFAPKLQGDEAKWRGLSLAYLEPMFANLPGLKEKLVDIGTFAGNIHFRMMNLPEFILMGLQMHRTGLKQGDYVDLQRVSKWAQQLAPKLAGLAASASVVTPLAQKTRSQKPLDSTNGHGTRRRPNL